MTVREYHTSDLREIVELFYDTVHTVNARDYTPEQLNAWADGRADLAEWGRSLSGHIAFVAEEEGRIVGFGDIDPSGYLDRLYVHKDCQRQGVAAALCDAMERAVRAEKIVTHASITARPFFEKRGYQVLWEQQELRHGTALTNYHMEKKRRTP